jgi:hypothetical protein
MNHRTELFPAVPYDSLASGIEHGPYLAAPEELVDQYLKRHQSRPESEVGVSDEQKRADIESEWQYDQHSAAVMEALENGRINYLHAHFMLDRVLRPWFIGRRNPSD